MSLNHSNTPRGFYRSRLYTIDISINPLIAACDPILTVLSILKNCEYPLDRDKFLSDLAHEIRAFTQRAQIANYPEHIISDACYVLCCLLDETIASTSAWGKNNGWLQNNLLTIFYQEGYGGEHFFAIVDRALADAAANLHLIELLYLGLSYGFVGKYQQLPHGKNDLIAITHNIYQTICQYHHPRSLFICKQLPTEQKTSAPQLTTKKIFGIALIFALGISSAIYFTTHLKLNKLCKPLHSLIKYKIDIQP